MGEGGGGEERNTKIKKGILKMDPSFAGEGVSFLVVKINWNWRPPLNKRCPKALEFPNASLALHLDF